MAIVLKNKRIEFQDARGRTLHLGNIILYYGSTNSRTFSNQYGIVHGLVRKITNNKIFILPTDDSGVPDFTKTLVEYDGDFLITERKYISPNQLLPTWTTNSIY